MPLRSSNTVINDLIGIGTECWLKIKIKKKLNVVAHTCKPSTWKMGAGGSVQGQPESYPWGGSWAVRRAS